MRTSKEKMAVLLQNITVVVRSSGERTTDWCLTKAESIFGNGNVTLIQEAPMISAIQTTFELAIAQNKEWTLEIDADVLLDSKGIISMITKASQLSPEYYFHFGMVFDKMTNGFRSAGNKLLKTEHIPEALKLISDAAREVRPDTYIRKAMARKGLHYYRHVELIGIHDFEQGYYDLYRKGYLQGVKNRYKLQGFMNGWPESWEKDNNYVVIEAGMKDGLNHQGELPLDHKYNKEDFDNWKDRTCFHQQKLPLDNNSKNIDDYLSLKLTSDLLKNFHKTCRKNKAKFHVRSKKDMGYRLMKLNYKAQLFKLKLTPSGRIRKLRQLEN